MSRTIVTSALLFAVIPSLAGADPARPQIVVEGNVARQVLAATGNTAFASSRIIYVSKNTTTVSPGYNDSRQQKSTLASQPTTLEGWQPAQQVWDDTLSCIQGMFAPFAVTVTDQDPGQAPHIEALFAGLPQQLGMPSNVAGVSPFTSDCSVIENSIVYTFAPNLKSITAQQACEIMSQEIAHSYGLDHELLAADPMTYLAYKGERSFQDVDAQCGESSPRSCGISGIVCRETQNSVQLLAQRVGRYGDDTDVPTVMVDSPGDGDVVSSDVMIEATASDDRKVTSAKISIDGHMVTNITGAGPYNFMASDLPAGNHTVTIEVSDGSNVGTADRHFTVADEHSSISQAFGGCSAGGGTTHAGVLVGLALFVLARRRR